MYMFWKAIACSAIFNGCVAFEPNGKVDWGAHETRELCAQDASKRINSALSAARVPVPVKVNIACLTMEEAEEAEEKMQNMKNLHGA